MQTSRKSFRALTMAEPIKKQIDDILSKLQTQKRKYLALQREQTIMKEQIIKHQRQLNDAKLLEPKTRVKQNKNNQTHLTINNTDRLYLKTINKISQIKVSIQVQRRQIDKYKKLIHQLNSDIQKIHEENNLLQSQLLKNQVKNETLKEHLLEYRNINMKNTDQFKNSFHALHRSSIKEENERRKSKVLGKNFEVEEMKVSKLINLSEINEKQEDSSLKNMVFMTNSIPLMKQRVRMLIHTNKEKLKISQNYKKFGMDLQTMFEVMKEYKGREDIVFISEQFVMKEKQLKKIQQYIGKLENRLLAYQSQLKKINNSHQHLKNQLSLPEQQENKLKQEQYLKLQQEMKHVIENLKQKQINNTEWFNKIGKILSPLIKGEEFNRSTVDKLLGSIEYKYLKETKPLHTINDKLSKKSPTKLASIPNIDDKQIKITQSMELMSYERLKDYAKEYIANKNDKN